MFRRKDEDFNSENDNGNSAQQSMNVDAPEEKTTARQASGGGKPSLAKAPAAASAAKPSQPVARPAPASAQPAFRPSPVNNTAARSSKQSSSSAAASPSQPTGQRILTVGHDILLKGEIATCDRLIIQGVVDAKLKEVHTVEISESGSFAGSADIEEAIISGLFEGNLTVTNRLVITSTGRVFGKITYGEIEIERGGELSGEISMVGEEIAKKSSSSTKKAA